MFGRSDWALPFQHLKIFAKFHFCTCAHLLVPVRKSRSWVQTTTSNKPRIQRHMTCVKKLFSKSTSCRHFNISSFMHVEENADHRPQSGSKTVLLQASDQRGFSDFFSLTQPCLRRRQAALQIFSEILSRSTTCKSASCFAAP